jgi:hypothetical protein
MQKSKACRQFNHQQNSQRYSKERQSFIGATKDSPETSNTLRAASHFLLLLATVQSKSNESVDKAPSFLIPENAQIHERLLVTTNNTSLCVVLVQEVSIYTSSDTSIVQVLL